MPIRVRLRLRLLQALLLPLPLLLTPCRTGTCTEARPDRIPACSADYQLVESLLDRSDVDRSPPGPDPSRYFRDAGTTFFVWFFSHLVRGAGFANLLVTLGFWLAVSLPIVALIILLLRILRVLRRHRERDSSEDGVISAERETESAIPADARACWQAMEQALARNQSGTALTALWWWLALRVAGGAADAAWTTRQLVRAAARSRQQDGSRTASDPFVGLCRRLDVMLYGPGAAVCLDIRELARELEEALS